ncbi:MAG: 30S ribosomal protein S18 [Planctomycetes bacterium]|jgi:small subunit ribosomal protein S18|nr:30S ribosomal protein S18 [Planctomycetota bacterium]
MSIEAPVSDRPAPKQKIVIDYKNIDDLRRAMTANGKIMSRKRAGLSARDQARLAQAIKRARFMALIPYANLMA